MRLKALLPVAGMLLAPVTLAADGPAAEPALVFEGRAYREGATPGAADALVYTEHHAQTGACEDGYWRPAVDAVTYRNPDGAVRTRKQVTYTPSSWRPSFTLTDLLFDETVQVTNRDDRKALVVHTEPDDTEHFEIALSDDAVIDAGFDQMVVDRWDALAAGETVFFQFVAPTRGERYDFEARAVDSDLPVKGEHVVRIQPAGFFTNLFVEPIFVSYNDDRYLTDYVGLGNIRRTPDENYRVHIRYRYLQLPDCGLAGTPPRG